MAKRGDIDAKRAKKSHAIDGMTELIYRGEQRTMAILSAEGMGITEIANWMDAIPRYVKKVLEEKPERKECGQMSKPIDEWREEFFTRAGGEDWDSAKRVRYRCPRCKSTFCAEDFYEIVGDKDKSMRMAPQYCIHRIKDDGICNWVSFGLVAGPVCVVHSDGSKSYVFEFADEEDKESVE